MSETSTMLLLGIGGSGTAAARAIRESFGEGLRLVLVDTDASSGREGEPFVLLGGDRLSGRGTGGDVVAARIAAQDSVDLLDPELENVRLAVVATCLGGGTGGGATLEVVTHLSERGIPTMVFATTPFTFEGDDRQRNSRGVISMIEDAASATVLLPLDRLVHGADNVDEAMRRATETLATGVTFFWRLVERPGYIRLDPERLRNIIRAAGRGRFATATATGPNRAREAIDALVGSELLAAGSAPVQSILCGVLAGEDLRLAEIGTVADGLRGAFGARAAFNLATVNDERTCGGRLTVVALLLESDGRGDAGDGTGHGRRQSANTAAAGRGRFVNSAPTVWRGEDLDTPTYIRQDIQLDF